MKSEGPAMTRNAAVLGILFAVLHQNPTGDEVLERCEKNMADVEDYVVDLVANVNMERLRMPAMKATMYFKRPDKFRFKSEGFMMLPREGFGVPVTRLRRNYNAVLIGMDSVAGRACYHLQLTAKNPSKDIQSIAVWVDSERFTIMRTSTLPYRGRSVTVRFQYGLQEQKHWLPVKLVAEFTSTQPDTTEAINDPIPMKPQLQEFRRPPRNGTVEIQYSNYRVDAGLPDDVFREESD